jgi:hypothetical protein
MQKTIDATKESIALGAVMARLGDWLETAKGSREQLRTAENSQEQQEQYEDLSKWIDMLRFGFRAGEGEYGGSSSSPCSGSE